VSTRVRILPLVLLTNLAMLAPAAGAASLHRASAWAQYVHTARLRAGWDAPSRSVAVARKAFSPGLEGSGALGPLTSGPSPAPFGFGSALLGSAPVRPGPSAVAVDQTTNTIYVANGNNANGPSPGGDTVSVIDGRRCDAADVSRCRGPWPTVNVGSLPSSVAVDQATDTVYVTILGDNTVAVFNGATCNGRVTWGCGETPAHVPVGLGPFAIFADDANHTVYVADPGPNFDQNTMSMIDTKTCRGSDLTGCAGQTPPTVPVGVGLGDFALNQATHTVYVGFGNGTGGVAAFDANTCNATLLSGCSQIATLPDPQAPFVPAVTVDRASNTIYAANATNTISVFDGRTCDANDLAGCAAETPGVVTVAPPVFFAVSFWLTVDAPLHTVYVVNQKNDNLAAVDTNACNGRDLPACATLNPPTIHTGGDPESVVVNQDTQTLYTANQIDNTVSVIDASRCNADTTSGCRHPAPALTIPHPGVLAADPAAHTTYVTSGANAVSMIDTRTCNAHRPAGCAQALPTVTVGDFPGAIAVDRRTQTVYVANSGAGATGTVSVINARTCNATHSAGCASLPTLRVPAGNPDDIAINAATNTVYVATITSSGPNLVSVFNGATCNAETSLGCHQTPATLAVGDSGGGHSSLNIAVNQATNTIYATNLVFPPSGPYIGDSVYMINGATCDAANTTGCGQTPATVKVGVNPSAIAVDQATNTIYTANLADGELAGSVSVINGATCNGSNTIGCGQTPQTVAAGFGSVGIAIDPTTHRVYVTNIEDTSVSVINGNTCNGSDTNGCGQSPPQIAVGSYPGPIAVDSAVGTAYVRNGDNTVSVIPLTH
jgi:DNA-binding beta-propeller fold protein YncE